jgi:hypothetical protein
MKRPINVSLPWSQAALAAFLVAIMAGELSAQHPSLLGTPLASSVTEIPLDTIAVALILPADRRKPGCLQYSVIPEAGIAAAAETEGRFCWGPEPPYAVGLPFRLIVGKPQPLGRVSLGDVTIAWEDGPAHTLPIYWDVSPADRNAPTAITIRSAEPAEQAPPLNVDLPPSRPGNPSVHGQEWVSVPVGGLTKDVEIELYGSTRATSPGGVVVVRYSINSFEDQDERVRLQVNLPDGWILLDAGALDQEFLLEAWESIEGEVRLVVPEHAVPGERHQIHVSGLVMGEPGSAEVFSYVQILRSGGLRPGQVGLTGTASLQATSFGVETLEGARYGGLVDLSGRLNGRTTLSLNYRQGPREQNLTNYRIAQEQTRWSAMLRAPAWQLQVANHITSSGTALTGPSARTEGVQFRRTQGLLVGDLIAGRPTTFAGDADGHILRGSLGLAGPRGRLAAVFSDFARPVGGYSTQPRYPEDIPPDSLERLERERAALAAAPSNRVQGAGLEGELRAAGTHRLTLRGGVLRLSNAAGDSIRDLSTEAQYSLNHRAGSANVRWRRMPPSLQGVHLPGDEVSADGSLRLVGDLRLAGRAYRGTARTLHNEFQAENEGASLGLRYFRSGWRFDVRGSHRAWGYGQTPTTARGGNLSVGIPVGPVSVNGFADLSEQDNGTVRRPTSSYRGDLRWTGRSGSLSWSASRFEALNADPRMRTDLLGSLKLGEWEAAGGAWATRGWASGGDPGFWTQIGVPVSFDLLLALGLERAPRSWGQAPAFLGTLGIRKKLMVPVPFLRHDTGQR